MVRLITCFMILSLAAAAYKIYFDTNTTQLEEKVNTALKRGATLVGGISTNFLQGRYPTFVQAVMFPNEPSWYHYSSYTPSHSRGCKC